jgi:hypothetical protein
VVRAAIVHHQVLDLIYTWQSLGQVFYRAGEDSLLVIAGDLDDKFHLPELALDMEAASHTHTRAKRSVKTWRLLYHGRLLPSTGCGFDHPHDSQRVPFHVQYLEPCLDYSLHRLTVQAALTAVSVPHQM